MCLLFLIYRSKNSPLYGSSVICVEATLWWVKFVLIVALSTTFPRNGKEERTAEATVLCLLLAASLLRSDFGSLLMTSHPSPTTRSVHLSFLLTDGRVHLVSPFWFVMKPRLSLAWLTSILQVFGFALILFFHLFQLRVSRLLRTATVISISRFLP